MERVVRWAVLGADREAALLQGQTRRPPFGIETRLRIHYMQQWFCPERPGDGGGAA